MNDACGFADEMRFRQISLLFIYMDILYIIIGVFLQDILERLEIKWDEGGGEYGNDQI